MSKSKFWIKTDHVPNNCDYITRGKWYFATMEEDGVTWKDDNGEDRWSYLYKTFHLNYKDWQVHYGDTPPDCGTLHRTLVTNNELSNLEWVPTILECSTSKDKGRGDTLVAYSTSLPVNEVQDVTKGVISSLQETMSRWEPKTMLEWSDQGILEELLDKLKSGEYSVINNTNID